MTDSIRLETTGSAGIGFEPSDPRCSTSNPSATRRGPFERGAGRVSVDSTVARNPTVDETDTRRTVPERANARPFDR
ncbi:hypothetical protein C492_01358 [Natronococcus jeotgali DSM 18795]|uniref:Uncharacterized protein n=1 Tax=Natronococcus jeotgali DSM 18795 TaxID=1227498 RepID=L9XZZ5_9EURY|nr:hypothetical protein C492_01358 [Natronococcus jeotgali DSM 18795]